MSESWKILVPKGNRPNKNSIRGRQSKKLTKRMTMTKILRKKENT